MFIRDEIQELVKGAVVAAFSEATLGEINVEYPGELAHGDYSTNIALVLAKQVGLKPREVAEKVMAELSRNLTQRRDPESGEIGAKILSKIEIAGPGFINFFLAPEFLAQQTQRIIEKADTYGNSDYKKGKTIVTDTSHPNIAKPMGVHHLLSTIIGNSINRILSAVGYTVIRDNYLGDWGTQYGKLMWAYKNWGDEAVVKKDPIPELQKLYVRFHEEVEDRPELEDLGRAEFKKLEDGDVESRKLWKWIVDLSIQEFHKLWDRLGVDFDYIHGESFYEDKMQEIIGMGIQKGLFVEGEKKEGTTGPGALIFKFAHEKYPPCIIRKSDGATIYATRDLARTKYWEDTWHPDLMVIVADTAQELHFKQFFEVAHALGITKAPNIHAWFGRMSFPEKRMSTRKGNIILMEELLDEAEERAYEVVKEKNPLLAEAQRKEVARVVGIGAVKYAVLAQNRQTNVTFTWDKMLALEGNSAPYLQYVYARAWSILRKSEVTSISTLADTESLLSEPSEIMLSRLLTRLPEVLTLAADELKPNLLANYLFQVASQFNSFYGAVSVMKSEGDLKNARLALVGATIVVLKNGLTLLGIEVPQEM